VLFVGNEESLFKLFNPKYLFSQREQNVEIFTHIPIRSEPFIPWLKRRGFLAHIL
jgi:hypothetical protein